MTDTYKMLVDLALNIGLVRDVGMMLAHEHNMNEVLLRQSSNLPYKIEGKMVILSFLLC